MIILCWRCFPRIGRFGRAATQILLDLLATVTSSEEGQSGGEEPFNAAYACSLDPLPLSLDLHRQPA
jgi:hypothetical protein